MTKMNWANAKRDRRNERPAYPKSADKVIPDDGEYIIATLESHLFFMTTRQREFALNCLDQNEAYGGLSSAQWGALRDLAAKVKRLASLNPLVPTQ